MRLTCPNCGAEYEPPRNMMPSGGRHVQCSACHTRWFAKNESRPLLTEDQIIQRLESRTPNLRVIEEPVAAPWKKPKLQAEPAAAPAGAKVTPFAAKDTPNSEPETREEDFSWETPETAPASAFAEAPSAFRTDAGEPAAGETDFSWAEPSAGSEPAAAPEPVSEETPAAPDSTPPAEAVETPEASPTTPVPPVTEPASAAAAPKTAALQEAEARPRTAATVEPVIIIEETSPIRFWLGFTAAVAVVAILLAIYFAARAEAAGLPVESLLDRLPHDTVALVAPKG